MIQCHFCLFNTLWTEPLSLSHWAVTYVRLISLRSLEFLHLLFHLAYFTFLLVAHKKWNRLNGKEAEETWDSRVILFRRTLQSHESKCQRGSPCQDPACNRITRRPPGHRKERRTAVLWSRLPFIRSGQNHLARHIERGKKTRQIEDEVGRQQKGIDRPGVLQVPEGSGEQGKWRKLVVKSPVMPQRPSRLRDSWWWRWWWWWWWWWWSLV